MTNREKVIKGLEWILQGDRFGFGVNWTADSVPQSEEEQAGYNIVRAIELLKEQEPKTAIANHEKYGDYLRHCPSCETVLPISSQYGRTKFCHLCGKAVKWE